MTKGFSLVELSISIIIIGLLVAGVTSGTKLIKQAEIRAIIADLQKQKSDYFIFQDIYGAVPGDFRNASSVFSGCTDGGGVGELNCNGNGDGYITMNMGNGFDGDAIGDEPMKVYRHFKLAGVSAAAGATPIRANYSFGHSTGNTTQGNFPTGTTAGSAITIVTVDAGNTGGSVMNPGTIGHSGGYLSSNFPVLSTIAYLVKANSNPSAGVITPISAFSIDRKIDDGVYIGSNSTGANTGSFMTITDITGGSACVSGANYTLTTSTTTCIPQLLITN